MRFRGSRQGAVYAPGDRIKVMLKEIDFITQETDWYIVSTSPGIRSRGKPKYGKGKRTKGKPKVKASTKFDRAPAKVKFDKAPAKVKPEPNSALLKIKSKIKKNN